LPNFPSKAPRPGQPISAIRMLLYGQRQLTATTGKGTPHEVENSKIVQDLRSRKFTAKKSCL
jgi:hypothetical protein